MLNIDRSHSYMTIFVIAFFLFNSSRGFCIFDRLWARKGLKLKAEFIDGFVNI